MKYHTDVAECIDSYEFRESLAEALEKGTSHGWTLIHQTVFQGENTEEELELTCFTHNYTYVLTWQLPEED